jgi:hypothetical protein
MARTLDIILIMLAPMTADIPTVYLYGLTMEHVLSVVSPFHASERSDSRGAELPITKVGARIKEYDTAE